MMDVGRVCIKIAGRDSGETAVVIDKIDENFVMIDGNVRRKRCNIKHLEPTEKFVEIQNGASTEQVHAAMKDAGLLVRKFGGEKKKQATQKPVRTRKGSKPAEEPKPKKTGKKVK